MSAKRWKEMASHSSSLPAKKQCLLSLRQETQTTSTKMLSPSGEQQQKRDSVNSELSTSEVAGSMDPVQDPVDDKDQCPTSLSSLKLVQICDTLENCDMDFKMDHWGQQRSPSSSSSSSSVAGGLAQQRSDQENREPNSRLSPSVAVPRAQTAAENKRHHHQLQRYQKKKELESMWKAVNQSHQKLFPKCNIGKRRHRVDQTEKIMVDSSISIDDIVSKLCSTIETSYDSVKTFAESIPGFQDFPQADRNILQQIGGLEVTLLHLACGFDKKTECLKVWDERWLPQERVCQLSKSSADFTTSVFFELLFSLGESINTMPLQFHDVAIFSALLLLPSDLQGIQNRQQVETLQEKVLNCLSGCLISLTRTCFPCLLAQLLMCMPTLRTLSTTYLELTSKKREERQS